MTRKTPLLDLRAVNTPPVEPLRATTTVGFRDVSLVVMGALKREKHYVLQVCRRYIANRAIATIHPHKGPVGFVRVPTTVYIGMLRPVSRCE